MKNRKFKKIASDGEKVSVAWAEKSSRGGRWEDRACATAEPAHEEFYTALQAFVPEVLQYHQLPAEYHAQTVALGVSLAYDRFGDRTGVTVDLTSNVPNRPQTWRWKSATIRPEEWALDDLLLALETEAGVWIEDRATQGDLFDALKNVDSEEEEEEEIER